MDSVKWKNFGETTTEERQKVFFSGKEDKHEDGVGFLVHKDIVNTVMGCRQVSSYITKHPENGPGIAQMDSTTTRLITF